MVAKKKVTRWSPSQKRWTSSYEPVRSTPSKPAKRKPSIRRTPKKTITPEQYKTIKEDIAKGTKTPSMERAVKEYESAKKEASPVSRVEYAKGAGDSRVQIIYYKDGRREVIKYKPTTSETLYKVRVPTKTGTKTVYMSKGAVGKYSSYIEEQRQMTAAERVKETPKTATQKAAAKLGEWNIAGSAWLKSKGFPEWEKTRMGSKEKAFTFSKVKEGKLPLGSWLIGRPTLSWYGDVHERMRTKPASFAIETGVSIGAGALISTVSAKGYFVVMAGAAKYGSKGVFAAKSGMSLIGAGGAAAYAAPKASEFIAAPSEQAKGRVLASATRELGLFAIGADLTKGISTRFLGKGLVYEQIGHIKSKPTRQLFLSRFKTTMALREQPRVSKFAFPETFSSKLKKPTLKFFKESDALVYGTTAQKPQMPFAKHTRELGDIDMAVKDVGKARSYLKGLGSRLGLKVNEGKTVINIGAGKKVARFQLHTYKETAENPFWTGKTTRTKEGIKLITLSEQAGRKFQGMTKGREKDIGDYYKIMSNLFKTKEIRIQKDILPFKGTRLRALAQTKSEFYKVSPKATPKQLKFQKPFDPSVKMPEGLAGAKLPKSRTFDLKLRERILKNVYQVPFKYTTKTTTLKRAGGEVSGYYDLKTGNIVIKQAKSPIVRAITKRETSGVLLHEVMHKKYYEKGLIGAPSKKQILSDYAQAYKTKDFGVGEVGKVVGQVKGKNLFKFIDKSYAPKYRRSEYLSYYAQAHPEQVVMPTTKTGKYLNELYYGKSKAPKLSVAPSKYTPAKKAAAYSGYRPSKISYPKTVPYKPPKYPKTPAYKPPKYPKYPKAPPYKPPKYPKTPPYKPTKYPKAPPYSPPPYTPPPPPPSRIFNWRPPIKLSDMKVKLFAKRKYRYAPSLRFAIGMPASYKTPKVPKLLTGIEERPFKRRK